VAPPIGAGARPRFLLALAVWIVLAVYAVRPEPFTPGTILFVRSGALQARASFLQQSAFRAPGIISASDVQYPLETTADGIIVLRVSLSARGEIANIIALTDIPPLTGAAESSLRTWKFIPASANGTTEASQILAAFVFRHAVKMSNPPAFIPVIVSGEQAGYIPAGIASATYADYPTSTIAAGATVVEVTAKADGIISNVRVVRGMSGGFVPLAVKAARQWQFQPAMLNGSPVVSKVAIAFVFSSRALNPF
jgi:hypothetical protein